MEIKYGGTTDLTFKMAIERLYSLIEKSKKLQPLGGEDEAIYLEAKALIDKEIEEIMNSAKYWCMVKDKLTAKQLLHILEQK